MNLINFLFLLIPPISWFGLTLLPSGNRVVLISYSIAVIILFSFLSIKTLSFKSLERSVYLKIFLISCFFIFLLLYGYSYRWMVEPFGMNDSNVLWNAKASLISNMFLEGKKVYFSNPDWKHNTYPIGLPTSLAFLSAIIGKWTLFVPYGFVISMSTILVLNFLYLIFSNTSQDRTSLVLLILIFATWLFQFNTFMIQSDLCADYPIIFGITLFSIFFFSEKTPPYEIWSLLTAWIVSMKNEGIILLPFLILLVSLRAYQNKELNKFNIFKFLIVFLIAVLPQIFHKFEAGILHQDFDEVNNKNSSILYDKVLQFDRYIIIGKFLIEYQFKFLSGIPIITTILILFFTKNNIRKIWIGFYWILHLSYSFVYLFTSLELFGHLDSSYFRIQTHIFPMIPFALIDYIRNDENWKEIKDYFINEVSKLKWIARKQR